MNHFQFRKYFLMLVFLPSLAFSQSAINLNAAINNLKKYLSDSTNLNSEGLKLQQKAIIENDTLFESDEQTILNAFSLLDAYDTKYGPMWLNARTLNNIPREPGQDGAIVKDLDRAVFSVMQGVMDHAYTPQNLVRYKGSLQGYVFKASKYFPGSVAPPTNPEVAYQVSVNASQPKVWGRPVAFSTDPTRRPTGAYVAPGSFVTVTVPVHLINKGYKIRIGAHSWDMAQNKKWLLSRLDRLSLAFPITMATTTVTNPVGGGIYLEVPPGADGGIVTLSTKGAVRSPFFSNTDIQKTSLQEWRDVERKHPGPWADFVSDKFMLNVPTSMIYNYDDPQVLLKDWDLSMDQVSDLLGLPRLRPGNKTVLYLQLDTYLPTPAHGIGYPMVNVTYNPRDVQNGNSNNTLLKGPQYQPGGINHTIFHELGHDQAMTKFDGEVEAIVNLLSVPILNRGFGISIDSAFGFSFAAPKISRETAAIMWMVTENFRLGKPMDITNSTKNEVRYQHRGYAKYVEIAALFGWDALQDFWHTSNINYEKGIITNQNAEERDNRILRLSRAAGSDLRPLIHFWGVQPNKDDTLKTAMDREGLKPSSLIYDRLVLYKSLIPKNKSEFVAHANYVYPNRSTSEDPDYAGGWYAVQENIYTDSQGSAGLIAMQKIIDYYFPNGRPTSETTPPTPNAAFQVKPVLLGETAATMTAVIGSDPSGPVMYQFREKSANPGGASSDWQISPTYKNEGLITGNKYSYTVRMRDALGNTTAASEPFAVTVGAASIKDHSNFQAFSVLKSGGIQIHTQGPHSFALFNLLGNQVYQKTGNGPAQYWLNQDGKRYTLGIYILNIKTRIGTHIQVLPLL
jgi:Peptidase M60, enhancin and enhancin-like/N-terminal domain of M60-like peptidases